MRFYCMNGSRSGYLQDYRFDTRNKDESIEDMFKDLFGQWGGHWISITADNAFPSVVLLEWCLQKQINFFGTARTTSGFSYELLAKASSLHDRGDWDWMMAPSETDPSRSLLCCLWKDSGLVKFMSNCDEPTIDIVERRVRATEPQQVPCPTIAKVYNETMGGTDGFDGARGHFTSRRISKKWWHSLHYFVQDSAGINSFFRYQWQE